MPSVFDAAKKGDLGVSVTTLATQKDNLTDKSDDKVKEVANRTLPDYQVIRPFDKLVNHHTSLMLFIMSALKLRTTESFITAGAEELMDLGVDQNIPNHVIGIKEGKGWN